MLTSFTPVPVPRFGSLVTQWPPDKLPNGVSPDCRNVRFSPSSVATRQGLTLAFRTGQAAMVTGLAGYIQTSGNSMPLVFDFAGRLWRESPAGSGYLAGIQSSLVAPPASAHLQSALAYNRVYLAFGDGRFGQGLPASYDGLNLDPIALAAPSGSSTVADSGTPGNVCAGLRYGIVMYQTRSGYISAPQAPFSWTAAGGQQVTVGNLPIGPAQVVARIVAFTVAGGSSAGPYFAIGAAQTLNGVTETATVVNDNVTAAATFNFDDTFLAASTDYTANFRKIVLPAQAGVLFSPTTQRLLWWGQSGQPSQLTISQAADPETYYGDTGLVMIGENDGQRLTVCFEFKGQIFAAKQDSLYVVIPSAGDPAAWAVSIYNNRIGVCGPRALDLCGDFVAWAHPTGFYVFDGSDPVQVSLEILDLWQRINWTQSHLIWVHIDVQNQEVRIGAPLDDALLPNVIFKVNYQEGWKAPVIFSPFTGDERAYPGRKWSLDDIAATGAYEIVRPLVPGGGMNPEGFSSLLPAMGVPGELSRRQVLFTSADADGAVSFLDPTAYSDNGRPIASWYQTSYLSPTQAQLGASVGIQSLAAVTLTARGQGRMLVTALPNSSSSLARNSGLSADSLASPPAGLAAESSFGKGPQPQIFRPLDLSPGAQADFKLGSRLTAERISLRFANSPDPGAGFELSAVCAWLRTAWRSRP